MKKPDKKNMHRNLPEFFHLLQDQEKNVAINSVIVGGGEATCNLLKMVYHPTGKSRLNVKILGLSEEQTDAPGLAYAKELGIFTASRFEELFSLEGIQLIIELTGSDEVMDQVYANKPQGASVLDHRVSRYIWDLLKIESERSILEKEYQQQEIKTKKKTQIILDSLPYRIMVFNLDKKVDTVNQTFVREFNHDPEKIRNRFCYQLRYQIDKSCKEMGRTCYLDDKLDQIIDKGLYTTYREFEDNSGATRYEVISIAPIFDENGNLIQFLEASRDVTERVTLEKEFEKSTIFLENVINSTVDGIVVVDTKGKVLIFNQGMEKLTGYSSAEITKTGHLTSFYDIDLAKQNMMKMRSHEFGPPGKLNPTSMSIKTYDGEKIPVTLSASIIIINGKEVGSVGVFTDMREFLKMRKDLEDAHLKLVQTEKIASVGRMAAGVAHEINNPLSGALIYAELLKEELKDNKQHQKDIQEIIDQTLRCKKIVSEMLEFSRQSVGKKSAFSLEYLINKCLDLLINQAIFQDIKIVKDIEPEMPQMLGDIGQLQQVFTNMFINAAHAMESRGRLGISANHDKERSLILIRISDTGPGIPADLKDKIFDVFFTTKPVGSGTGLGLSISHNIIKLHGGNISFECPDHGGTVFIVELPVEYTETQMNQEPVFIGMDES